MPHNYSSRSWNIHFRGPPIAERPQISHNTNRRLNVPESRDYWSRTSLLLLSLHPAPDDSSPDLQHVLLQTITHNEEQKNFSTKETVRSLVKTQRHSRSFESSVIITSKSHCILLINKFPAYRFSGLSACNKVHESHDHFALAMFPQSKPCFYMEIYYNQRSRNKFTHRSYAS